MFMNPHQHTTASGFTLIELLVSLSVFIVAVMISTSSVITVLDLNKKAASLQASVDNAHFVMDVLARDIRFGTNMKVDSDGGILSFTNSNGPNVTYELNKNEIVRSIDGGSALPLTFDKFSVEKLHFMLVGSTQPLVVITVEGVSAGGTKFETPINIQTSVAPRALNM